MDLSSRLRAIVKGGPPKPLRELTYEPDIGGYEAVMDLSRVGAILGGQPAGEPMAAQEPHRVLPFLVRYEQCRHLVTPSYKHRRRGARTF